MITAKLLCMTIMAAGMPNSGHACNYMETVVMASNYYELDPHLVISLIHEESRWKPNAVSKKGACGLMQLLPKYTRPRHTCKELKNPEVSIWLGTKTLKYWLQKYGRGNEIIGLCGYNAGYRCKGQKAIKSGKAYARRVRRRSSRLRRRSMKIAARQAIIDLQRDALGLPQ